MKAEFKTRLGVSGYGAYEKMDVRTSSKILAAAVFVILISFSVYVFADQGYGYGRQSKGMRYEEGGCSGPGWNRHHMGPRGYDREIRGSLSDEVLAGTEKNHFVIVGAKSFPPLL